MAFLTPEQKKVLRRAWQAKTACRPAGREAGCAASTALAYFYRLDREALIDEPIASDAASPSPKFKIVEAGDARTIEATSPKRIKTLEDAVAFAEVDLTTWRVKSWECTSWEVVMKIKGGDDGDKAGRHGLWRVSLKLERVAPKFVTDGLEAIFKKMESKAYRFDLPHVAPRETGGTMFEIQIPDLHLGKLCWAPETGSDYDLKIAEEVYDHAVVDLLRHARNYDPDLIVFLMGSDFFHSDTLRGTTTSGTPLDMDGRLAKIFEVGFQIKTRAIERALGVCGRIKGKLIPGNHDSVLSLCHARAVAAQFSRDDRVDIDYGPCVRKYMKYGCNLIGLTHGHGVKRADLPLLMATERPEDWAATTCREWHLNHLHTSKAFETKSVDEHKGVIVRVISSMSGTDAWHFENGFVGNRRAAEAFVYEKDHGFVANFVSAACR